jgi:hypothetical protein
MFDQNLGYDNSLDVKTETGLITALAWIGMSSLIRNNRDLFKDQNLYKIMMNPFTLEKFYELFSSEDAFNIICLKAFRNKINLFNHPTWHDLLKKKFEDGIKDPSIVQQAYRSDEHYINFYLGWNNDVDWMEIYTLYLQHQKKCGYVTVPFIKSLDNFFRTNPLCARTKIEEDLFESDSKPDAYIRAEMYRAYIRAGFLDKKKARKIRSETSESVSASALNHLFSVVEENPGLYPNYTDMILQFTDTKYHSVQQILAERAPYNLLYAFVGFDDRHSKNLIERRMQNGK